MKENKEGVMMIVDISKALDIVPHRAIGDGLKRKGIAAGVAEYIQRMCDGCQTKIRTRG